MINIKKNNLSLFQKLFCIFVSIEMMGCAEPLSLGYSYCSPEVLQKAKKLSSFDRQYKYFLNFVDEKDISQIEEIIQHYEQINSEVDELLALPDCSESEYLNLPIKDGYYIKSAKRRASEELQKNKPKLAFAKALDQLYQNTGCAPAPGLVEYNFNNAPELIIHLKLITHSVKATVDRAYTESVIFIEELNRIKKIYKGIELTNDFENLNVYLEKMISVKEVIENAFKIGIQRSDLFVQCYERYLDGDIDSELKSKIPQTSSKNLNSVQAKEAICRELNILTSATDSEVKKAYHQECLKRHPDKGGNTKKFQILNELYKNFQKSL